MPELEYFVVARSIAIDPHTNEITLAGVLEEIELEADNSVIPKAVAAALWNLGAGDTDKDLQAQLRIQLPGESRFDDFTMNLNVHRQRIRCYFAVLDIPLNQAGTLVFELRMNGHISAHHRVAIVPQGSGMAQSQADQDLSNEAPP